MRAIARASGFMDRPALGPDQGKAPAAVRVAEPKAAPEAMHGVLTGQIAGSDPGIGFDLGPEARALALLPRREPKPRPSPGARPSVYEARKTRCRDPASSVIPAGQTTQMVIGASPETDASILNLAENLYLGFDVRRVYYSAFVPTGSDPRLPVVDKPPLAREHRLYQADWLFRFYGFTASEILEPSRPFLERDMDPKSSWALRNLQFFPVELLAADYPSLLRVPGIGPKSASRIIQARRSGSLRTASLSRLGVVMRRAKWFLCLGGRLLSADDPDASPSRGAPAKGKLLERPEFLRSALLDPAFRQPGPSQAELPWGGA